LKDNEVGEGYLRFGDIQICWGTEKAMRYEESTGLKGCAFTL
jgi:hypothetical protein